MPDFNQGILARNDFSALIETLQSQGYTVHAPLLHDGSVTWGEVNRVQDLPRGWQDHQRPGKYELEQTESSRQAILPQSEKTAFLGIRACDLAGLAIQDRISLDVAHA